MFLLALAVGVAGGVAGGVVVAVVDDGSPSATPGATATPVATLATVATGSQDRLQSAIDRVLPAVVTILADAPLERDEDGNLSQQRNIGSGIVLDEAGHIVTNFHVIDGAAEINVVLTTGEERPARVVSHDSPFSDLAVIEIPPGGLRTAQLGDSDILKPGEPVAVIAGAGFTTGNSVKVGVVSGVGREWLRNGAILEDLVQTDAAVNNGDSGGALINADGEIVGLMTSVVRTTFSTDLVQGVSFAQSSNSLRPIIEDIILQGSHLRPRLGIEYPFRQHIELTPEIAAEQGIPLSSGALVVAIELGSAAQEAGVLPGDVVVAVNGAAVDLDHPLVNVLKALAPGETADLTVVRDGQQLSIPVFPRLE